MSKNPCTASSDGATLQTATISTDFKIHVAYGEFYLLAPYTVNVAQTTADLDALPECSNRAEANLRKHTETWLRQGGPAARDDIVAIDPGVRKPFTTYSPQGVVELLGHNANAVIDRHLKRVDARKAASDAAYATFAANKKASSRAVKRRGRASMRRFRRKWAAARLRQANAVKHFHYNVAHHLVRKYRTIILPTYSMQAMVGRDTRNIRKQVVRRMHAISYGKFATRIQEVASLYAGTVIKRVSEAYTSKTCGGTCGRIHWNLGKNEVFDCPTCSYKLDRDVHASRNILLRNIIFN